MADVTTKHLSICSKAFQRLIRPMETDTNPSQGFKDAWKVGNQTAWQGLYDPSSAPLAILGAGSQIRAVLGRYPGSLRS